MPGPKATIKYDRQGRVKEVKSHITRRHLGTGEDVSYAGRNHARQRGLDGDDASHIIAKRFGGHGGPSNIVPMAPNVNRGAYKEFENWVGNSVERQNGTTVKYQYEYRGNSERPSRVNVSGQNLQGEQYKDSFSNRWA